MIRTQLIQYLMIFLSVIFSLSAIGASLKNPSENISTCNGNDTIEMYNKLTQKIEKNFSADLLFNLGKIAMCLDKEEQESLMYFQKASDAGHIPATFIISLSYYIDYLIPDIFKLDDSTNNLIIRNSIKYAKKAAYMIEALPHYPEGATNETSLIESTLYVSHRISVMLPLLYLQKYLNTMRAPTNNEKTSDNTLDILNKIQLTATKCLEKPALDIWKEKKDIVFQMQQNQCNMLLEFVTTVHPLEQQRIKISKACTVPVSECTEHQELYDEIESLVFDTGGRILEIEEKELPFMLWSNSAIYYDDWTDDT